ncbi:hypothetical protein [Pyxidicoccus xibeiensis]|uniref:hypothetical protein n=1 Tax=Pyxidicoccus xibeiensis TaxID=2906759 RepID=UPI0020A7D549|nr:hypothetical protein [Pyxidicoccus xibeiensis]MCP3137369.1 hypothetical protein [Pyxidicoccus xibeiensis]
MRPAIHVMERLSRVAPLGVRFRDEATGTLVGDGLEVSAFPLGLPAARRHSIVNRSGIHVLMDLPGLRDLEYADGDAGDDAWWAALPARRPYTVEVRDTLGRFLPCAFRADLPHRGLFTPDCVSSPPSPLSPNEGPAVPLYSAPSRQSAVPMAVLRAELWDQPMRIPAAWALVEATPVAGGVTARGMADAQGRLALFFQYPEPVDFAPGSPLDASSLPAGPPLLDQSWALQVRVHYARRTPVPQLPDVCLTLSQPPAGVWADSTGSPLELLEPTLRYGQELVLRTQNAPQSRLWITPP